MKLFVIFTISIFLLLLSPNLAFAQKDPLENPKVPYMTDGEGNGYNPGSKKSSSKILEDLINIFFNTSAKKKTGSKNNSSLNTVPSPSVYITQPIDPSVIPDVPQNQNEISSLIASIVHADCTSEGIGIVTKKNTLLSQSLFNKPDCVSRTQNLLTTQGIKEIHNSVSPFYYVQCVACARAMAVAMGRPLSFMGNAKDYIGQSMTGYSYVPNKGTNSNLLIPGSIGISNEGTYGHIYYISDVYKDSNGNVAYYLALECNYGGNGYLRHDIKRSVTQLINGTNTYYLAGWHRPI
jgi:hypothetical protein